MKLKIISDGTPLGTKVVDENGQVIEGITAVKWGQEAGHAALCQITFINVALNVESEVVEEVVMKQYRVIDAK